MTETCSDFLTIVVTDGSPVVCRASRWPVVARGVAGEAFDGGVCRGAAIILRKHADGRIITEASYVIDGKDDVVIARLGDPTKEARDNFLATQIRLAAAVLLDRTGGGNCIRDAADRAYAALPETELE